MLLTDTFTYVHMPKTGGTFVTSVLERLHGSPRSRLGRLVRRMEEHFIGRPLGVRSRRYGNLINLEPKHGTCHDIPESQAGKPILSCMRSPLEWYASQYEFGWWKRTFQYDPNGAATPAGAAIEQALPHFAAAHPNFPEISFGEFMQLCMAAADIYNEVPGTNFGLFTHGFVRYFYRDPDTVLRKLSPEYVRSGEHLIGRFDVTLMRTERLNTDLPKALSALGYRDVDLAFIGDLGRILPMGLGRNRGSSWQDYYTADLVALVRERDRPLFAMFRDYEI